ncbi:DUF11 domain-containing protein [Microbacterium testaceum]|uniref:DUF11 domain-containing protein n=1 Tax=Microbacterium testaceum TaxID=2033 RepID=UPI002AC56136|nr:DUF11 domain-containing protein [Microbacterium testaceum]MDZ5145670.1 DUF11 domain-containing protein [Microbacterium testaceum]
MIGQNKRRGRVAPGNGTPGSMVRTAKVKAWQPRLLVSALLTVLMSTSMVGVNLLAAGPAHAAVPAFDPARPLVFLSQNAPTRLYEGQINEGNVVFNPVGEPRSVTYNAISYNTADNFLYGVIVAGVTSMPRGTVIRIGSDGAIEPVGNTPLAATIRVGGFGPGNNLYLTNPRDPNMTVVSPLTGSVVRTVTLSRTIPFGDWSFADGFFWGVQGDFIYRVDPTSGKVDALASPIPNGTYGAAWTYGNGNLGFLNNDTGAVFQVAVNNAGTAPAFTAFAAGSGPTTRENDGAASPGRPTDLSISKTGPATLIPGGTVTYKFTVENNGPNDSNGFLVSDKLPEPLSNARFDGITCKATGNDVTCSSGPLAAGASTTFTITADVPSSLNAAVTNSATVIANEEDVDPSNNTSSTTGLPGRVGIETSAATSSDRNGNGITDAGDQIQFSYRITNGGQLPLTDVRAENPKLDTVSCPVTELPIGASTTCSATYTVTTADIAAGTVENTVTANGATPSGAVVTSAPSSTTTPLTAPAPQLNLEQSADVSTVAAPGDRVTYSYTVKNTGNVPVTDVGVASFGGQEGDPAVSCPSGPLAVGASATCTHTYTAKQADIDAGAIDVTAVASGTAVGGGRVQSELSSTTTTATQSPGLTVVKSAEPITTASPGTKVQFSFVATNTGNVTLDNVRIEETAFSGKGDAPKVSCPAIQTDSLTPGGEVTCTATYTLVQADIDAGELRNTATANGNPPVSTPAEKVTSQPSSVVLPMSKNASLSLSSVAVSAPIARASQEVTITFRVENSGNVSIADPRVTISAFSGTGRISAIVCPAEPVLPGQQVDCTATYTVTQADLDVGGLAFTGSAIGTAPDGSTTEQNRPLSSTIATATASATASTSNDGVLVPPGDADGHGGSSAPALASTGANPGLPIGIAIPLLLAGSAIYAARRFRREAK